MKKRASKKSRSSASNKRDSTAERKKKTKSRKKSLTARWNPESSDIKIQNVPMGLRQPETPRDMAENFVPPPHALDMLNISTAKGEELDRISRLLGVRRNLNDDETLRSRAREYLRGDREQSSPTSRYDIAKKKGC